jgi:hypothetical protein
MSKPFYSCLFFLLVFIPSTFAQQTGRMETDRPDQTECPYIVKKGFIQIESGISFIKEKAGLKTVLFPTVLTKYGLSRRLELRLLTELNILETPVIIPWGNTVNYGLVPVEIGAKFLLMEEKGLLPQACLLSHLAIPRFASKKFQSSLLAPTFIFLFQNTINKTISLGYNLGIEWDGESKKPYNVYTIALGINMGQRWYSYLEIFGSSHQDAGAQHTVDGGLAYYVNDNIKIDCNGGFGIREQGIDHFFGVGFSIRFK